MKQVSIEIAKEQITNLLTGVRNAYPSIYSKDDVTLLLTALLDNLEGQATEEVTEQEPINITALLETFTDKFKKEFIDYAKDIDYSDCVDLSSAELELNYNEISVQSISMNETDIISELKGAFDNAAHDIIKEYERNEMETI